MKSRIHKYHNRKTGKEQIGLQIKTAHGWAHLCYPNPPGGLFIPGNEVVLKNRRESLKNNTDDDFDILSNSQIILALPRK